MTEQSNADAWWQPVRRLLEARGNGCGILLQFPAYRPDLTRHLAQQLGIAFLDYRAEVMAKLGWEAHTLSLAELNATLREHASCGGLVAHNVEALLATKPAQARREWLSRFIETPWSHAVLVPLFVYADEASQNHPHCLGFAAETLPQQSFIARLAELAIGGQKTED